jgi:hypothetical protein
MARRKGKKDPKDTVETPYSDRLKVFLSILLIVVLASAIFYPITRYFFAQDDFILMLKASAESKASLMGFIKPTPGQFRPLSKVIYFGAAYKAFGLNPLPYHLISLFLYILNAVLFYILLRKFRLRHMPALLTTLLYALSTSFINVVAWISCIQQLLGQLFALATMIFGLTALEKHSLKHMIAASAAYVLALLSIEQVAAIPLVLLIFSVLETNEAGMSQRVIKAVRGIYLPFFIMVFYFVFMLLWRRIPTGGPYELHLGRNVIDNIIIYLHWAYAFSIRIPFLINSMKSGITATHLVILAAVLFNLTRGRTNGVIVALSYYLLTILPVLFLENHTYFTHTYIPAFGMLIMLGWTIEDFTNMIFRWKPKFAVYIMGAFIVLIPAMSFMQVQANINDKLREDYPLPRDYVLRRAIIAKNVYEDIKVRKMALPRFGKFFMVFLSKQSWYSNNVQAALGEGSAIKLFFGNPDLQVFFHLRGDTLNAYTPKDSQILFYDHMGHVYTESEVPSKGPAIKEIGP